MPQLEPSNSDTWVSTRLRLRAGCLAVDGEAVIHRGDLDLAGSVRSLTGWLAPWWPWCIFRASSPPSAKREHLVAEADAEHRLARVRPGRLGSSARHRHRSPPGRRGRSTGRCLSGSWASTSCAAGADAGSTVTSAAMVEARQSQDVALDPEIEGDDVVLPGLPRGGR